MGHWGTCSPSTSNNFIFSSLWSKYDSQLFKYCVVREISWCRCQQLTALSISTALVTKLLVIEQLLHPALRSTMSAPWHNFQLCPSSHQIMATPLCIGRYNRGFGYTLAMVTTSWRHYDKPSKTHQSICDFACIVVDLYCIICIIFSCCV